mgnify:CR=1 FL=1
MDNYYAQYDTGDNLVVDLIVEHWGMVISFVLGIGYLFRTEANTATNSRDIKSLSKRITDDEARNIAQRKEDQTIAKDNRDKSDKRLDDIASDIKEILRGLGK